MQNFFMAITPGWKSLTGGIALIILGMASLMVRLVAPDTDFGMDSEASIAAIAAGLGIIGLADKAERARRDVEQTRQKVDIMKKQVEGLVDRNS